MTIDNTQGLTFTREVLIYIPAYNCEKYIAGVLNEIPDDLLQIAEILIVDNCSTDDTTAIAQQTLASKQWPNPVHLIQPNENLGYAGSQKLAYSIALESPSVKRVMMLHGDGQYPPELLRYFVPYLNSIFGVVYGFRDKSTFPDKEETPAGSYRIIKTLGAVESFVTGHQRKEWHTGFVMYSRDFLAKVNLQALTDTYHIDGHLQFVSGELNEEVLALPIWKRYKEYEQLKGLNRFTYIFHVLRLMIMFRVFGSGQKNAELEPNTNGFSILSRIEDSTENIS